jgi:hypothetical protein
VVDFSTIPHDFSHPPEAPMRLDPENLAVSTFETSNLAIVPGGGYCCTGCDSGCGINPTAGGCESGGQTFKTFPCGEVVPVDAAVA